MPSYKTIEEGRRKAMEDLIDEIMEELRVPANIPVLHECRTLFRKKVPLTMRAYVAAALAYRFATPGNSVSGRQAKKGQIEQREGRHDSLKVSQRTPQREFQRELRREPRPDQGSDSAGKRNNAQARQPEPRHDTQRETPRENRYQGEGVVLFVGAGRRQRFYARIVLRMLVDSSQVTENQIGDIRTMDNYSFINIDPAAEEAAIHVLGGTEYKGRLLTVNRAKKKEDQASQD